jgi:predicted metal-binding membrane protein
MNYELMWMALRHALIEESSENPDNAFYPAVILLMSGMEQYSDLQEKELKKTEEPFKTEI